MVIRALLAVPALILLLTSCGTTGPQYRNQYVYAPPASAEGRTCVAVCRGNRQQCIGNSRSRSRQCAEDQDEAQKQCFRQAGANYRNCLRRTPPGTTASARRLQDTHRSYCRTSLNSDRTRCNSSRSLAPSTCRRGGNCNARYRSCYRQCGGRVTTRRVCVRNCN